MVALGKFMGEAGRPSDLTEEVLEKIKKGILDGLEYQEIAKLSEVELGTFYAWTYKNYCNLSDKIEGWRRDRKLKLAEENIERILADKGMISEAKREKIQADMSQFVAETLGKENYSKKTTQDSNLKGEIIVKVMNYDGNNNPA